MNPETIQTIIQLIAIIATAIVLYKRGKVQVLKKMDDRSKLQNVDQVTKIILETLNEELKKQLQKEDQIKENKVDLDPVCVACRHKSDCDSCDWKRWKEQRNGNKKSTSIHTT